MTKLPRTLIVALAFAAAACDGYTLAVANRQPFQPLPIYGEWWEENQRCSGLAGDLTRIEWFTASSVRGDGAVANGLWSPPHRIILVAGFEENEIIVRHEMLHDLLRGDANHVSPQWQSCELIPS